jgi:hypothetical protein
LQRGDSEKSRDSRVPKGEAICESDHYYARRYGVDGRVVRSCGADAGTAAGYGARSFSYPPLDAGKVSLIIHQYDSANHSSQKVSNALRRENI